MERVVASRLTTSVGTAMSAAVATAVTAAVLAGCAQSRFPDDAAAYFPGELGGRKVVVDDPQAARVAATIDGKGVASVRAAALPGPSDEATAVPPVIAVATVEGGGAETVDAALFRPVDDVRNVRIGGADMRTARSRQAGREVEFTVWRPTDGIVVVAAGVDGGRRAARESLAALVTATRERGDG